MKMGQSETGVGTSLCVSQLLSGAESTPSLPPKTAFHRTSHWNRAEETEWSRAEGIRQYWDEVE